MRIAIIADAVDNQKAGVHVFAREMILALIRNNPSHELILIREKRDPALKNVEQVIVPNTRLPVGFASIRLFILVPLILLRKKIDVVVEPAHFGPFNLPKKIRRVTIIHDLTPVLFPHLHRWHSQILQRIFLRGILNKADIIIANSENTKRDICKTYPSNCKKVEKIYPGKSDLFIPHRNNNNILKKYKINSPYFLNVGTIEPRKNLMVLLEAFRIYKERIPDKTLLVIAGGRGWKSESFYNALNNHPNRDEIICTGYVEDAELPALYSHAMAMIYPSVYEGFGLPVIESMSCLTPVIAADNSSLKEAGGNLAAYFQSDNAEELAMLMMKFAHESGIRRLDANAVREHLKQFDWDKFAVKFYSLISPIA
jgi:glycosyltransferase involved in cell wall biosynthesis